MKLMFYLLATYFKIWYYVSKAYSERSKAKEFYGILIFLENLSTISKSLKLCTFHYSLQPFCLIRDSRKELLSCMQRVVRLNPDRHRPQIFKWIMTAPLPYPLKQVWISRSSEDDLNINVTCCREWDMLENLLLNDSKRRSFD